MDMRQLAIRTRQQGLENNAAFAQLRRDLDYPSQRSTLRWSTREQTEGHYRPYAMNGNRSSGVLVGEMRLKLVMYRILFPKATAAEVNCYLYNVTPPGQERRFYSGSQICRAEDDAGLTRKRGSTTARQANLPHNIDKRDQFRNEPYPYGILDTPRASIIDFDQAAIFIETTDRGYGKCAIGNDLNEEGPYGHSKKYTMTLAVSGDPAGQRFLTFELKAGTSVHCVVLFLQMIINDIGQGTPGNRRTFICDNLRSHKHHLVRHFVAAMGHRMICRAPYCPRDGPVEYVFNRIQHELSLRLHTIHNEVELEQAVYAIVRGIHNFENYFIHCGYNVV
jgi:hypothetical protein